MSEWGLKEWNAKEWVPLAKTIRNERYIRSQFYKYYVEVRKYDPYCNVEDILYEIRAALRKTFG